MIESDAMREFRSHLEAMCMYYGVEIYVDPAGVIEVWRRPPDAMNSPIQCRLVDCIGLTKEVRRPEQKPPAIPELTELKRVSLRPGDVVALMVEQRYSTDQEAWARGMLKDAFPNNDSLILSGGLRIGVIGRESEA